MIYQKLGKTVYEFNEYSFLEAIPNGIKNGTKTLTSYVKSLSLIFNKEGAKQIGGFGSIGSMFANEWDWQRFWAMTAFTLHNPGIHEYSSNTSFRWRTCNVSNL